MKFTTIFSQRTRKRVLWVVGIIMMFLILCSCIYEIRKKENWETSGRFCNTIAVDSSDRVWMGTDHGIGKLDGKSWEFYTTENSGLIDDFVTTVAVDSFDRIWAGTFRGTVALFDGKNWETIMVVKDVLVSGDPTNVSVNVIAIDSFDRVWIGTQSGVIVFDGKKRITYTKENSGLAHNYVLTIAFDSSDRAWLGTLKGMISLFDGENWATYVPPVSNRIVSTIAIDSSDQVWVGAGTRVFMFNGENWKSILESDYSDYDVNTITIDSSNRVWVGAGDGVSIFDGENLIKYTEFDSGLLNLDLDVESIVRDNKGLILICNKGVHRQINEKIQVNPVYNSFRNIFFSTRFSLWLNLYLLVSLGVVSLINARAGVIVILIITIFIGVPFFAVLYFIEEIGIWLVRMG